MSEVRINISPHQIRTLEELKKRYSLGSRSQALEALIEWYAQNPEALNLRQEE
jgi:metal-responsive CopG/Arc/MetJ family transcriptional regulator